MKDVFKEYIEFIRHICKVKGYKKDWNSGGCYMHLEVSEFIEALRGKGDPEDELGDVLFTVLAVADYHGLDIMKAIDLNKKKHMEKLL